MRRNERYRTGGISIRVPHYGGASSRDPENYGCLGGRTAYCTTITLTGTLICAPELAMGWAYRSISPTGPGTPSQDVDQLLQPFRRLTDQVGDGLV
jgi:hypothetical protein